MSTKPENPPAFPDIKSSAGNDPHDDSSYTSIWTEGGMTLRDYFAGKALAGMLAHATRYKPRQSDPVNWHDAISQEAFEIAEAMLAARQKETP